MENLKDIENLDYEDFSGINILYRKETTDLNCLNEVLNQRCYRSVKHNFDVLNGESWLDLGGNIGAFGIYAMSKGAKVRSYEPDNDCFEIMEQNYSSNFDQSKWKVINFAVTSVEEDKILLYKGGKTTDRYRLSTIKNTKESIELKNVHASKVFATQFDGCKWDIEGSEFGLIDNHLIPNCDKLIMEYHISKDKSMRNFHSRMDILRQYFTQVLYMPSLDRFDKDSQYPGFFDRIIICKK